MRSNRRNVGLLVGALVFAGWSAPAPAAGPSNLAAQYRDNLSLDSCAAAVRAADFLLENQLPDSDGSSGWSFVVGEGGVAPNMSGINALALLEAAWATGDERYLEAARRRADELVARLEIAPAAGLPYKPDVELLARLAERTGDSAYRQAARSWFERLRRHTADAAAEVARIAAGRSGTPELLGYDVAQAIRAALTVGERSYAYALADEILRRSADWYRPARDPRFSVLSAAALTESLAMLDPAEYRRVVERFRADLTRLQRDNGAWLTNETQATAYAVLALLDSARPEQREAARKGLDWLRTSMLRAGSFAAFNDNLPEPFVGQVISAVCGESLVALSRACLAERGGR